MRYEVKGDTLRCWLGGRITAENVGHVEREIFDVVHELTPSHVILDVEDLVFLSSAGLRVVLQLAKASGEVAITNATREVYEVFEKTGLTKILEVRRAPRDVSLAHLTQIGKGAFGRVFRLGSEQVAKVYDATSYPLERIEREREVARTAFVHGVPSAIPFETIRTEDGYGIIYEMIDAQTIGEVVTSDPSSCVLWAQRMAELAIRLHTTSFAPSTLPDARQIFHGWVDVAEASALYAPTTIERLRAFVDGIPTATTFVHGDFHPANVMVVPEDELVLIDMADASVGHPAIDMSGAYHVMRVATKRPGGAERLCAMTEELLDIFWDAFVRAYYCLRDDASVAELERNLALAALPRTMGSNARSKLITDEVRRQKAAELEGTFLRHGDEVDWGLLSCRAED